MRSGSAAILRRWRSRSWPDWRLETEPEAIGQPEIPREAQIRVGGHRSVAEDDLVDPAWGHPDGAGEAVPGQAHRLDEVEQQDVSRRGVGDFVSDSRRLRIAGTFLRLYDADAPLLIDADILC